MGVFFICVLIDLLVMHIGSYLDCHNFSTVNAYIKSKYIIINPYSYRFGALILRNRVAFGEC